MIPEVYNFRDAYQGDNYKYTLFEFSDDEGDIISMSSSIVSLNLINLDNKVVWSFSSTDGADTLITFDSNGSILIPEIKEWSIKPGQYRYDLQVKDVYGNVTTYLKGTWKVIADITKTV